ncbi:unnamed protein product [Aspergillus oryzae]|nr:unnamed protein product [Aspergillus oryzae]
MTRFMENFPSVVNSSTATGWLTSILQLGGVVGSLSAGVLGELYSRKYTMFVACCWVILGSYLYVGATEGNPSLLYAGRFFTGLGVGLFSGVGPLYNAELAAPEMRGLLVSFYQFATILGIMISFWVGYGSNYIGGTGETQSDMAWRLPSIVQGIPAVFLACGIWFMPFSPRWLVKQVRDEEALTTLAWIRKLPQDHELVQMEFLEMKAEALFEKRAFAKATPWLAERENKNVFMSQIAQYANCFRTMGNFKRVCTAWLVMFFQQWSGVDASRSSFSPSPLENLLTRRTVIYYASNVFTSLGLTSALIWLYIAGFGATWGPCSWTLVSEIFPLSIRAKGASIGAFSNWINNFAIAFFVPPMLEAWAWGTYIFFAVFLGVGIVWVWFFLPETKNASLEEMDRVFKSNTGEQDAEMLREAQREVGLTACIERLSKGPVPVEKDSYGSHLEQV